MLDPFYLIVDTASSLETYLPLGLRCVQLRIKDQKKQDVRQEIRAAKELCSQYSCFLIVNDYWQLAIEEGCGGLHLGQEDLIDADMQAIKSAGIQFGISTHDRAELNTALALQPSYVALGPIYQTTLKKMPWRPQGVERLAKWRLAIGDIPLVAIGGFSPDRAAGAFQHGANSVCVVTDVSQHAAPTKRVQEWLAITQAYRLN